MLMVGIITSAYYIAGGLSYIIQKITDYFPKSDLPKYNGDYLYFEQQNKADQALQNWLESNQNWLESNQNWLESNKE